MTNPETTRTERQATPQERERLRQYRTQIEQELPELRRRAKEVETAQRETAMQQQTVSGQLRRAIAESGCDHRELAGQIGVSGKTLAEFLVGTTGLDSSTIDKLASLLKQQLKPIG